MDINTAATAGTLAKQIAGLQGIVAQIQTMLSEGWTISMMQATAPETGSQSPAGTVQNLLPFGPANTANSQLGLTTALQTYQATLDALNAQLAAL